MGIKVLLLVLSTVFLGLLSAVILKEASLQNELDWQLLLFIAIAAVCVNGMRFIIWGFMHKHYPLSLTYPLSSLFFPLIFLMSCFYGEEITVSKLIGVVMITLGVAVLAYEQEGQ